MARLLVFVLSLSHHLPYVISAYNLILPNAKFSLDIAFSRSPSKMQGICPICVRGPYKDPIDHGTTVHKNFQWTPDLAARLGGVCCDCGALCRSELGRKQHKKGPAH